MNSLEWNHNHIILETHGCFDLRLRPALMHISIPSRSRNEKEEMGYHFRSKNDAVMEVEAHYNPSELVEARFMR